MSEPTTACSIQPEPGTPSDHERRASQRHRIRVRAIYQMAAARTDDFWWYANIQDLSNGGLSLHVLRAWELGTLLSMAPMIPPVGSQIGFPRCKVIHVGKAAEGGWILGCEFTEPLREHELAALLSSSEPA